MFSQFLQNIFKALARHLIARKKPRIIAVTGTVGKTSAKEAIASVLASTFTVRTAKKNYNNEWGVPFTILDIEGGNSFIDWIGTLGKAFWNSMFTQAYPEILVLEFGIDKPGDMVQLCEIVQLDFAVITALGGTPVHVENFSDKEALWKEKLAIAKGLKPDGVLLYNADDEELARRGGAKAAPRVLAFGVTPKADIWARDVRVLGDRNGLPVGISCTVVRGKETFALSMPRLIGAHQLTSVLASAAMGIALKVHEKRIQKVLESFTPPRGRLKLLPGLKQSFILDDTYNASPSSTQVALEVLGACSRKRRIAVMGDMLELGAYAEVAHRAIGRLATKSCDMLLAVGSRARFIADQARKEGFPDASIREFGLSPDAGKFLQRMMKMGDVVLVKGSQGMRMEKIVEEIMAEPQRKEELLVRQDVAWRKKEVLPV
ncbi:MAG: UDP-N-acetylmuramoyl-tripeptide--D-alanyl-D-alanine ligase [bacterium]|nr:UDP-N-acetylmuramoyl-tripeptide--D-alanyl-D-alanine ligase [bacterium]